MGDLSGLRAQISDLGSVITAFSGGADSALLAWVANDVLGANALAVTAVSPSLAPEEHEICKELADEWNLNWQVAITDELANPDYSINDGQRCYYCKTELMNVMEPIAKEKNASIILGVNLDDLGDHRPGQVAANERGAIFPFVENGFTKQEIRELSKELRLRTWDKPAAACLSSRIPYGTPVTITNLSKVAHAETALRGLGFKSLRVRHYGDTARIEIDLSELSSAFDLREQIVNGLKATGYRYVTLDLEGLRSGNLNEVLSSAVPSA